MSGTARDITYLFDRFKPVTAGGVVASKQDLEDLIASIQTMLLLFNAPSYDDDTAAAAGGVPAGQQYRNGNFINIRAASGPAQSGSANGMTVAATGSTTKRTLAQRAGDVVNLKDKGGVLDGTTDDTAAIDAARTAAGDNGIVVVPKGGWVTVATPTGGSTSPILWQLTGNAFGTGTTPVNGIGTDTIETTLTGSKFFTRTGTVPDAPPVLRIDSTATNTGGTAVTQSTLLVNTSAAHVSTNNFIWGITSVLHSQSTGPSQNVSLVAYGYKDADGAPVWGSNIAVADTTGHGSSTSGALIANEFGNTANGTDTGGAANDLIPAASGIRVNLDVVHSRYNPAGADAVFGWGVRVGGESTGVSMNYGFSLVNFTINRSGYSTDMARFAVGADAFRLAANQTIGFDGATGAIKLSYDTSGAFPALSTTAPALLLNNGTSNRIVFAAAGIGAPTFTTQSAGTKITLFPTLSGSAVDFGIGVESGAMWFSVNTTANSFHWYGGQTTVAALSGGGILNVIGAYQVNSVPVVGARATGWGAAINGSKAAFDGATATLAQTSAALASLIFDLTNSHGLIGP